MFRSRVWPFLTGGVLGKSAKCRSNHFARRYVSSGSTPSKYAPLEGIKVLDLTRILAGPYCTMILGDLGAEIIKVEKPGTGDDTRTWTPPPLGPESAYFVSINRNKKSITVNMKSDEGVDIIKQMAQKSDVFVENYRPGKMAEMGLGYEQLKTDSPHLIYVSISGFGQTGPYSKRAGYDNVAAAVGGLMHITGPSDGEPCRVGVAMTDLSTGLYAYGAILGALLHRQKTGHGQHIDCNLLSTQVATLTHIASNYLNCGIEAGRYGSGHTSIVPYQAFMVKDGRHFMVGAANNHLFRDLCKTVSLDQLASDERFLTNENRVRHRKELVKTLSDRFAELTLREWEVEFEGSSCPYGPVNNMQEVFSNPQVAHSGLVQEMEHPAIGRIKIPGPAVNYSAGELALQCPPPMLGQHTDEVLAAHLGLTRQQLQHLHESGAIG